MRQGPWKLIVNRAPLDRAKARNKTEPPPDAALFDLDHDLVEKTAQPVALTELKPGDILRMNLTREPKGHPAHCTDLWITADPKKAAAKAPDETRSAGAKQDKPAKWKSNPLVLPWSSPDLPC